MAKINKVTEQKINGVCCVAVLYVCVVNRIKQGSLYCEFFFPPAKSSNMKGNTVYACNIHKQVKLQIFTACVFDRGGRFGWMSHIVPAQTIVTSLEGREGWNLRGVTVINSPFNNSCPTWPASPSQCPLCIYAYVYLCIHSMQEITTAGVQSFFFFCACSSGGIALV